MDRVLTLGIVALIVAGICLLIARKLTSHRRGPLPYQSRATLLTPAEQSFYAALRLAADEKSAIFAKVRLADLLEVQPGLPRPEHFRAFNRISAKHVDFVLCDHVTSRLLCAIELDDSSHVRRDRQHRDRFLNDALSAAGIPLLRIPAQRNHRIEELRERLRAIESGSGADSEAPRVTHRIRTA